MEGLPTTFSFTIRLLLKDSPTFYEQNEATIIGKKYRLCRQHNNFALFLKINIPTFLNINIYRYPIRIHVKMESFHKGQRDSNFAL